MGIELTLSRGQVERVVRLACGERTPSVAELLADSSPYRALSKAMLSDRYRTLQHDRRLSRSLLAGLLVLSCFPPPKGVDLGIKEISEELDLSASTVHRYVATLMAAGLLERDPDTRRYRLAAQ